MFCHCLDPNWKGSIDSTWKRMFQSTEQLPYKNYSIGATSSVSPDPPFCLNGRCAWCLPYLAIMNLPCSLWPFKGNKEWPHNDTKKIPSTIILKFLCSRTLQRLSTHTCPTGGNDVSCFQLRPLCQKGNAHQNSVKGC